MCEWIQSNRTYCRYCNYRIGILAAMAIPFFTDLAYKAHMALVISDFKMIGKQILLFQTELDELPDTLDDIELARISTDKRSPNGN